MDAIGIPADHATYVSLLQGCVSIAALPEGKLVHAHFIQTGFNPNTFLQTKLLIVYAKCRFLVDGRRVFDEMPERNVVTWTALIAAYSKGGFDKEALTLLSQMRQMGIESDEFTFASVLPSCANLAALEHGKEVHEAIIRDGFQCDVFIGSALLDLYFKCGSLQDACKVFDKMPEHDTVSTNVMLAGYTQNGLVKEALKLFHEMPDRDTVSWNTVIAGCAQNGLVCEAAKLFQQMPERSLVSWNTMISGYAQNGHVNEALKLFQEVPKQDTVSWNTMIAGYVQNGYFQDALNLFRRMQETPVIPNAVTFACILPACAGLAALGDGKEIHEIIIRSKFQYDIFVGNALMDMYAKCSSIEDALKVFDRMPQRNVVSWTTMVAGYAQDGHVDEALKFFQKMPERNVISWNAMIAGYAQTGYIDEALELFQNMPERDVVSWNAIISGYTHNGNFSGTLKFFQQMQVTGVRSNCVTFTSVLPACANLAALEHGKKVHEDIIRSGVQFDTFVSNALVDMYAKCGSLGDAYKVFIKMPQRDVVSWTAMIVAYATHGCGKEALQLFEQMQQSHTNPNEATYIGILSACCHAGLVDDGWKYFDSIARDYHITPTMDHYCCMVDLLGRAGHLNEAYHFINKMPIKPNDAIWGSLLGACRNHANIELGELVADHLLQTDSKNAAHYVLLSNIYAAAGRWADVEKVRKLMINRKVRKTPGCSWIELNDVVYTFLVGDRSHPQTQEIYAELDRLYGQIKEAGYVPDTNLALRDVEEEQKEDMVCHHSEKLAIAFGLINTPPKTPIRIIKNLRVCGECHLAIKFISKIVVREFFLRDATRFHHFKDGKCSCRDYW
jgi:pentatricopeptide repeat protein